MDHLDNPANSQRQGKHDLLALSDQSLAFPSSRWKLSEEAGAFSGLATKEQCGLRMPGSDQGEKFSSVRLAELGQEIQALAQTGLTYATDRFDRERYERLREIAAEMLSAALPTLGASALLKAFAQEVGYATPKVDVRALVVRDGRVLLVREAEDGLWSLPGGWADVGDRPSAAVEREVREECGLEVQAERMLGLWDRNLHGHPPHAFHIYKVIFLCEERGGELRTSNDSLEVGFFDAEELPPLSLTRIVEEEIRDALLIAREKRDSFFD